MGRSRTVPALGAHVHRDCSLLTVAADNCRLRSSIHLSTTLFSSELGPLWGHLGLCCSVGWFDSRHVYFTWVATFGQLARLSHQQNGPFAPKHVVLLTYSRKEDLNTPVHVCFCEVCHVTKCFLPEHRFAFENNTILQIYYLSTEREGRNIDVHTCNHEGMWRQSLQVGGLSLWRVQTTCKNEKKIIKIISSFTYPHNNDGFYLHFLERFHEISLLVP